MTTTNEIINSTWKEIFNLKRLSNCTKDATVEFWDGTIPPTEVSVGHQIAYGNGVDDSILEEGDRFFIRTSSGYATVCITRKV